MKNITLSIAFMLAVTVVAAPTFAQKKPVSVGQAATASPEDVKAAGELAKAAFAAHGGAKLKEMRTLVGKGTCDLNVMSTALPCTFSTAISGTKYRFDVKSAVQDLKQIYDGNQTFSSVQGFSLPPFTSLGFPLLPRLGDNGYTVTAVPDKKKRKGFRMTTPDGFYTDFFVDEKTGLIKSFESSYEVRGQMVSTSVEIDQNQTVDGIVVPKKFSQRFDLGQMTAYASFNTKEILVNSPIDETVFVIPN